MFNRRFFSWMSLTLMIVVMLSGCVPISPVAEAPSAEAAATAAPEEAAAEEEGDEEPPERGSAPEAEVAYAVDDILVYNADPWSKIKVIALTDAGFDFEFCDDADCTSSSGGGSLDLAFDGDAILTVDEARTSSDIPDDQKQALNLLSEEATSEAATTGSDTSVAVPYAVDDILVYNADPWSKIKVIALTDAGFDFEFCDDADCTSSSGGGSLDLAFDGDAILTVDEAIASSDIPDDQKQALNLLAGEAAGEAEASSEEVAASEEAAAEEEAAVVSASAAGCTGPSQDEIATILAEHERIRQEATAVDGRNRAPQMKWSPELACQAEEWAKASVDGTQAGNPHQGNHPHSKLETWANAPLAESMAGGREAAQDAVRAWEAEKSDYDLMTGACSAVCGHYVFIIMPNMTEVGCGFAKADTEQPNAYSTDVWVCQYRGTYPWEEGKDFVIWDTQTVNGTTTKGWWAVRAEKVEGGGVRLRPLFEDGKVDTSYGYSVSMGSVDVWPLDVAKQKGFQINY